MVFSINPREYNRDTRKSYSNCPIGQSLKKAFKVQSVGVHYTGIYLDGKQFPLPKGVLRFIKQWDSGKMPTEKLEFEFSPESIELLPASEPVAEVKKAKAIPPPRTAILRAQAERFPELFEACADGCTCEECLDRQTWE
jgi:hypothetical protein